MKMTLIILTLIFLSANTVAGQQGFFVKNKKSGRLKKLKPTTNFRFEMKISDSSKRQSYFGRIIQMTDSTITIEEYVKPSMRHAVTPCTYRLATKDVNSIKNYLIDNDDFNTLGGSLVIGGVLALVATPIVWVADGKEAGTDGAIFTAELFGAGGLLLLPQFIGKSKRMAGWQFVKR